MHNLVDTNRDKQHEKITSFVRGQVSFNALQCHIKYILYARYSA